MSSIIFSDLHNEATRVEEKTGVLKQIREYYKKLKASRVFFLGDLFDVRGRIPTVVQNAMANEFRQWDKEGISLYMIPGNHDYADKNGLVHSMEVFKEFKNIHVFDESSLMEIDGVVYGFIPYVEDLAKELVDSEWYKERVDYLFIHNGVEGAKKNEVHLDTESRVKDSVFNFVTTYVFAGHYHYAQELGKVIFVGSCMQQRVDERDQDKGFILLDESARTYKHFVLDTPRYIDYTIDTDKIKTLNKKDFTKHTEKDYVRIYSVGDFKSYSRLNKSALEGTCSELHIEWKPKRVERATRIKIKSGESRVDTIRKYVEYMIKDQDKQDRLIKLGKEIYNDRNN